MSTRCEKNDLWNCFHGIRKAVSAEAADGSDERQRCDIPYVQCKKMRQAVDIRQSKRWNLLSATSRFRMPLSRGIINCDNAYQQFLQAIDCKFTSHRKARNNGEMRRVCLSRFASVRDGSWRSTVLLLWRKRLSPWE